MLILRPWRWPRGLKAAAFAAANAVLLYLCLAPGPDLPPEPMSDKAEHGIAWAVLTLSTITLWPRRPAAAAGYALAFGALIEVLQTVMPLGRDGDWRDWIADAIGVGAATIAALLFRRLGRR